ncbi:MAG TPA: TolC family protein [Gemmatimonadales bacterium]|jgi:outer membrane protein TolC|nr:TolC family protein [Gemmatimonadales bacterium]
MRNRWILVLAALFAPASLVAQTKLALSFGDAVKLATGQAAPVQLSTLTTDEARARVRQARASYLPGLTAGGAWVNRDYDLDALGLPFPKNSPIQLPTIAGPFTAYDARLTFTQTLLDLSSIKRVRASEAQVQSTLAASDATTETAAQVAALAYLRAARAQASITARQADSSIAAEVLSLAQAQLQAGVSGTLDVTRAKTQVAVAAGALVVARNQYDQARIALARALGVDPVTSVLTLNDTLTSALGVASVPGDQDGAVAQALNARPELKAEQARGNAAVVSKSAIESELLPRVGFEADYGLSGLTLGSSRATRQFAVAVSIPLLDGFRREGRAAEQDAVIQESQVRQHDLRQQIAADVAGALLDLHSAEAQEGIASQQLSLAADELSQAEKRFKAGVAGNIEVIDAQASMVKARDAVIDARYGAAAARVALARAAGAARTLH